MAMESLSTDLVCEILLENNVIDDKLVQEIKIHENAYLGLLQKESTANGSSPITGVDIISSMGLNSTTDQVLSEDLIMRTLASHWKLPFLKIDLSKLDPSLVTSRVPESFAKEHLTIPVSISENILFIAVVNPLDEEISETMKRASTLKIRPVISTKTDILEAIEKCYGTQTSPDIMELTEVVEEESSPIQEFSPTVKEEFSPKVDEEFSPIQEFSPTVEQEFFPIQEFSPVQETTTTDEPFNKSATFLSLGNDKYADKHIVNTVNLLLNYALEQRTSEIHLDPKQNHSVIRFCIDGMLYDVKNIPLELHSNVLLRFKSLTGMDISERHKPQDGQTQFDFHDRKIYLRISTMPVASGEKIVLRILDSLMLFRQVEELGFSPEELKQYMTFISRFGGIILITGPAGSGKTTTLYSTLDQLSERGINITTIENLIESVHERFDQITIHPKLGMTFETAMRHIIRQSPGVIMVEEMRDEKSVEQTVRAALAGHLVLSALHTHDTTSAIVQLINMGIQPFLVGSTIIAVVAQRLVRRVCDSCARPARLSAQEIDELRISKEEAEKLSLRKGTGCMTCRGTGYFGQTAIFEIMEITDEIRALIHQDAGAHAIKNAAIKQGMHTLRAGAIEKMKAGITTCEEVFRVTGGLKGDVPHKFKSKILLDAE